LIFVFVFFLNCCCGGGCVVRGFDQPGIESEDSSSAASHEDPLSRRERSFTGNYLFSLL